MTGPPTPPPTTETELKDAARSAQPPEPQPQTQPAAATTVAQSQPAEDESYTSIFPAIVDFASKSDWRNLIKAAEYSDLNRTGDANRRVTRLFIVAPLVLSYLIIDDLPPARYALTRLPDTFLHMPLGQSLLRLVASTMERKYANIYSQAENLFNVVREPGAFDEKLASVIANLILSFLETFRTRTFKLLSKAYTSLPLALGQVYLGLTAEQLLAAAEKNGWSYEPSSGILSPVLPKATTSVAPDLAFSSLSTFHFVANSVARLEM